MLAGTHWLRPLVAAAPVLFGFVVATSPSVSAANADARFIPVGPVRLADTRSGVGFTRIDAQTIRVVVARAGSSNALVGHPILSRATSGHDR
jgi:hypothetical protein